MFFSTTHFIVINVLQESRIVNDLLSEVPKDLSSILETKKNVLGLNSALKLLTSWNLYCIFCYFLPCLLKLTTKQKSKNIMKHREAEICRECPK